MSTQRLWTRFFKGDLLSDWKQKALLVALFGSCGEVYHSLLFAGVTSMKSLAGGVSWLNVFSKSTSFSRLIGFDLLAAMRIMLCSMMESRLPSTSWNAKLAAFSTIHWFRFMRELLADLFTMRPRSISASLRVISLWINIMPSGASMAKYLFKIATGSGE